MKPWLVTLILLPIVSFVLYYQSHPLVSKVRIGDTVITTEVAATEAQKQKGLGFRSTLADNHGMLFPYDHKEQYNFWMKGMQFPLDFLWIDGDRIVDITENVPFPSGNEPPVIVKPAGEVNMVLEVHAGTVKRAGIHIGDAIEFLDR